VIGAFLPPPARMPAPASLPRALLMLGRTQVARGRGRGEVLLRAQAMADELADANPRWPTNTREL
jgi:hypothetical protein